jgi:predicted DNA-binding protein
MAAKKPNKKDRRAEGQTTLTISLPEDLKKRIEHAAQRETRSTSNYLVKELMRLLGENAGGK